MPLWKQLLLSLYYDATRPVRAWNRRRWAASGRLPAIVLFWHRIADDRATPWTTPTALFVRQIQWLQRRFPLVSLDEAQRRIRRDKNHEPCVSITFDDGYADNLRHAIPLLVEKRIPCTYFVTAQNVLEGKPFPDDLALGHRLAPNSPEQLVAMATAGIEIGAHGYHHADLGANCDPLTLYREVVAAKEELQRTLGRLIRHLAFPYGLHANLNPAAFALAEKAGYAGVCSAYGGFNYPGDDAFHLQRISADNSMIRMKNWVTMDPRKLHTPRFEYQGSGARGQGPGMRGAGEKTVNENNSVQRTMLPLPPNTNNDVQPPTPVL
jgi:peptidoglycan/xylan/chitin deacetylase (PgdA/CDA1 family)